MQTDVLTFFIFLLLFWMCFYVIGKLFKLEKRGWEIGPLYFLAKTTKLNRIINKIAMKFPRFWRVLWTIGIGFGFVAMAFIMVWFGINLYALITAPQLENAIVPFIPGVTVTGLPLLYMIIPIAIIMLTHEIAHGIAARIDGVTVKSSGFLALILLFGAFVELDEEQVAKKSRLTRQRIFVAGSFINLIIALFSLIIVTNMYSAGEGSYLYRIEDNSPSYGILQPNEIVIAVNGVPIRDSIHLDILLDQFKPFDPVNFTTKSGTGSITNHTVVTGFNRSKINKPWESYLLNNGTLLSGSLENLTANDQIRLTFNSSNNYLNFTLLVNISSFGITAPNLTALVMDLALNASLANFNVSKVYLANSSNPSQPFEFFSLQNLTAENNLNGDITRSAGFTLEDYVNGSDILAMNFVFDDSSEFEVSIDLCNIYMLSNQTPGYFGIWIGNYRVDRELAIILGPLAPHVYQTLFYLYMFSLAVGLINLLPIPPFDGDRLFVSLFKKDKPHLNGTDSADPDKNQESEDNEPKPKEPWTWVKTVIWSVRGLAIFLFLSNIILSLILFDIFSVFSGIFY